MKTLAQSAVDLHKDVPPDWYYRSIFIDKNKPQNYVHKRRFKEVGKLVEPSNGKILDIGCADGVFTKVVLEKSKASQIIGIDTLKKSVDWASKKWKRNKEMRFMIADAHSLPFPKNYFDAVFALEVLEHVFEPIKVLQEIKRVLKKTGYVIVLVPSENFLFKLCWYFWTKGRGKIWKETHVHAYSGDFLIKLIQAIGFKIVVDKKIIFGTLHLIKAAKK